MLRINTEKELVSFLKASGFELYDCLFLESDVEGYCFVRASRMTEEGIEETEFLLREEIVD